MENVKKVYTVIALVSEKLSKSGISKDKKNQQQGYSFRGIDDVYNALAPLLAEAKLCILPNVLERSIVERETKTGGALFYVTVKVDFAFVAAEDGSEHHVVTYGEAMDTGDKATNKAMSAAYKYAAMQAFCIPTEGDNDADNKTHEVLPNRVSTGHPNAIIEASGEMSEDMKEVVGLAKKAFKDKLAFALWLGTNFQINKVEKLDAKDLNKAKGLLADLLASKD